MGMPARKGGDNVSEAEEATWFDWRVGKLGRMAGKVDGVQLWLS